MKALQNKSNGSLRRQTVRTAIRVEKTRVAAIGLLAVAVLTLAAVSPADAQDKYLTNIPDFYQHQLWEKLPGGQAGSEKNGGWCAYAAITDALYPWNTMANYNKLFGADITTSGKWLDASNTSITNVQTETSVTGIAGFLDKQGVGTTAAMMGNPSLATVRYTVNSANGQVTAQLATGPEIVKKGGAPQTVFPFYVDQSTAGRTSVLMFKATAFKQNNLW